MGLFGMVLAATAMAAGFIASLAHLTPSNGAYVFGNAKITGVVLEVIILLNTLLFAGTVSSMLINSFAGLIVYSMLELGLAIKGGKKLRWDKSKWKTRTLGFYTEDIAPSLTSETLAEIVFGSLVKLKNGVIKFGSKLFSLIFRSKTEEQNNAAVAA
jgi:uncharacterized membrane protein